MPADYKLPSYTVYIDTSAAYSKKPTEPVSAKLLKWLRRARAPTNVDVRVPAVVLEELGYQRIVVSRFNTRRTHRLAGLGARQLLAESAV